MWLFSRHGFYSVVQDKADPQLVQVRARVKDDLEGLRQFSRERAAADMPAVISTATADYAYRVVVEKALWTRVATALAADVDYTNFKDTVHGEADRDDAYYRIWSAMNELQRKRKGKAG